MNWWFIPCERVSFLPHGSKVRAFSATYRPPSSLAPSLLPTPSDRVMVFDLLSLYCARHPQTLTTLVTFSITTSLLAIPALLTSFVLVWRSSILGTYDH